MDITPAAWLPHSFSRLPCWRWARASWLVERHRRCHPHIDDDWTARARDFLLARAPAAKPARRRSTTVCDPVIAAALELWQARPATGRWRVEGYLLTREPWEVVARRCALAVPVVAAYHSLFFCVRDRPCATDWLMARAVRGGPWNHFAGGPGVLWRYAALAGGPLALEVVIAVTLDQPFSEWVQTLCSDWPAYRLRRLRLACKLLLAVLTARSDQDFKGVLEALARLRGLDRRVLGRSEEPRGRMAVMEDFLKGLGSPAGTGRKAAPTRPTPVERTAEAGGAVQSQRLVPGTVLPGLRT